MSSSILPKNLLTLLSLILSFAFYRPCTALFCRDWCTAPYCSCAGWGWIQFARCNEYWSGHQCQCPYSRTNIADHSFLVPNSLKGSLALSKSAEDDDDGTAAILAGTWLGAFEAKSNDGSLEFEAWIPSNESNNNQINQNVWSIAKTTTGVELIGTPEGVWIRPPSKSTFRPVFADSTIGAQGHFAIVNNRIFVGTFDGLYTSTDEGETWSRALTECQAYGTEEDTTTITIPDDEPTVGVPKPPAEAKYCDAPVTDLLLVDETTLIVFYMGYGGAHRIDLANDGVVDPSVEAFWQALPSFQNDETCQGGFCHVLDATLFQGYLYVAFQSLHMAHLHMNNLEYWETVILNNDDDNNNNASADASITVTAVTAMEDEIIIAATSRGLYASRDGETWELISHDTCSDRHTPPLMSLGMEYVKDEDGTSLLFGTVEGPWIYRMAE